MNRSVRRHRVHQIERSYRLSARSQSKITAVGAIPQRALAPFGALPQPELVNSARIPFKEQRRVNRPRHQQPLKCRKEEVTLGPQTSSVSAAERSWSAYQGLGSRRVLAFDRFRRACLSHGVLWPVRWFGEGPACFVIRRLRINFANYKAQSKLQDDLQIFAWIRVTQRSGRCIPDGSHVYGPPAEIRTGQS
jgi:hypothetical protein